MNNRIQMLFETANTCEENGDLKGSLNALKEIISLGVEHPQVYINKSNCEYRLGNFRQAEIDATNAIELDPNDEMAYYNRGAARYEQQDYSRALNDFDKAISIKPNYKEALNYKTLIKNKVQRSFNSNDAKFDISNVYFISSDHLRYENGLHTSGPHGGAKRAIKIEPNISGGEGYTVTLYNLDNGANQIQMAPKQMEIIHSSKTKIKLKGFGQDRFGASFADYALTLDINEKNIDKITLHLIDRSVDIEYLK